MTTWTLAPHTPRRGRNRSRRFLAVAETTRLDVDGVTIIGRGGHWYVDAAGYSIEFFEDGGRGHWEIGGAPADEWLTDPHAAIRLLRQRGLLPKAAS